MTNEPKEVFRIIDRETDKPVGSYSRAYHDEFDFNSAGQARNANCHGMFEDRQKYKINKYRVTYELIEDDCDKNEPIKEVYIPPHIKSLLDKLDRDMKEFISKFKPNQ